MTSATTASPAPAGTGTGSIAPAVPGQAGSANDRAARRWSGALMNNFVAPPVELVSGRGAVVVDADGNEYLDLLGGIAVNALGHAHPAVVAAVSAQIATLGHVSNFFSHPTVLELAERLLVLAGARDDGRVLFCNSGAEANEAAFKIARLTGRPRIIATENGFHGRTMGALALTGQPAKRAPFEPMPAGVEFVPYGDVAALRAAVTAPGEVAAVFLEAIQGEAGVVPAPDGYLAAAREITSAAGALLVLDEVQTGIGRTGAWFAHQHAGIRPDVVTLAKGLGGGLPIGAVIGIGRAATLLSPGQHGSTFAGNPVCAAAALAVLSTVEQEGLLQHADSLGKHLAAAVEGLGHPLVSHVRGRGLLLGIVLTDPVAPRVADVARDRGFVVNATGPDVLRLAPPLVLTTAQADGFVAALPGILDAAAEVSR
ncbi:acetylornithine transaminase [Nakamurella endophytica]|uniref:Acetylornithine aminotransferase n=1 Tax=Nakamurella endophytica TaxID=1748367 RepID=A0A917T8D2_9ACTN|nr:acetylornithine transaminase [Nakamurella endophytica]GGM13552.1 acetylornithine aminotransferase [Nakamurella endophytica]